MVIDFEEGAPGAVDEIPEDLDSPIDDDEELGYEDAEEEEEEELEEEEEEYDENDESSFDPDPIDDEEVAEIDFSNHTYTREDAWEDYSDQEWEDMV
ncbi:MAG: hypothetical protein ACLFQK_00520 [Fibrobacterota bacterium]